MTALAVGWLYLQAGQTTMALDCDKVRTVADLARLALDPADEAAYVRELSDILEMADRLSAADTSQVTPMAHPLDVAQRMRPDEVTEADQREAFQVCAPTVEDGLYLVPRVIE